MKKGLIIAFALIIALSGCGLIKQNTTISENIDLYFALKGNEGLDIEQRSIEYEDVQAKFTNTMEEWVKGPSDMAKFEKSISDTVKVLGTSLEQDKLTVNLSQDFNTFGGVMHEAATIASLVNTMVQFPEVNSVRIMIEGKDMIAPSGNPYGYMSEIQFDPQNLGQLENREVTLYFSDDQAMFVVPEKRSINIEENAAKDKLVKALIEEMIKGPENTDLYPTIPEEARVNSVVVVGERATIDFSEEMYTKHSKGAAGERMTLVSIANTITEIAGINEVVLTLNGKPLNLEHAIIDSNNPLIREEDMILIK
ncbi:MAG: Lipoprotein LpqB, GerMN domain protein [Clostridia bacterium]|jgi:germination protein M|nr:Lipoprotein LpqB, GerMN domain protein [Clostridia bacterium]